MASSRVGEREAQLEPSRSAATYPDCDHKYSLLIVIGEISFASQAEHVAQEIERGVRSWDVDLTSCNLDLHLRDFLKHHSNSISKKGTGQKCLWYSSGVFDIQVLIRSSQERVYSEVCGLLTSPSGKKLLVLAGQSVDGSGDLLLDRGLFSPHHLTHILTEQFVDQRNDTVPALSTSKPSLTLSCPNTGQWRPLLENQPLQTPLTLHINPPMVFPAMDTLGELTSLLSDSLSPLSPFDLLPPPGTVGFLKLSRPCCYVFPAGRGVCAFFAVNGFTMLVDGGSESQSCFWKLVRHLDRVDAVLLTHAGTENLPGVNALLDRKVAELDMGLEVKDDLAKRLISPELGVVFFNAPSRLLMELQPYSDSVLRSRDQAARTIQLLKKLNVLPQPLFRPRGASIEPLTLFQKMGVGRLELYVLNPAKQSQDYQTFMQDWPDASTTQTQSQTQTQSLPSSLPVTSLASVCALLVWHPACPQEKVVRVLFPGATPQGKLLDGLERLNGLAFLQRPTVTAEDLKGWGEEMGPRRTESQDSGRSVGKETTTKSGSGRERGSIEEGKKEGTVKEKSKVINRNGQREEGKKEGDKIRLREVGVKQRAVAPDKASAKKGQRDVKKEERTTSTGKREENGPKRKEPVKKESLPSKPKNGNKSQAKKEVKNDVKTGGKRTSKPSGKEIKTEANLDAKKTHGRTGPLKNHSANANTGSMTESVATETTGKEEANPMMDKESEENPSGSKMSTPEDMTAEFLRLGQETERKETQEELLDEGEKTGEARNEGSDRGEVEEKDGVSPEIREGGRAGQRTEDGDGKRDEDGERTGTRERADGETGAETGDQDETLDGQEILFYNDTADHPVKAVGFPSPLTKTPKSERSVHLDLTPTEYTLLDGALRESPSSRPSPEDQCPPSAEEETVDSASPQSRANSAGHTPYGLSPDDVWVCRENFNSKMSGLGTTDNQPLGSYRQCEGQPCGPKSTLESHTHTSASRDKHLSFLSLGPLKEGLPDVSPSVTTTTTHSLPAEVSSPQSTEVDESLSMSFEQGPITASQREGENSDHQSNSNGNHFVDSDFRVGMTLSLKKPHRALVAEGSEMGHPPGPNTLHFESPPHDVDLCLVSPCEFKHFKPPGSSPQEPQLLANPPSSGSVKASLHDLSDDSDHSQEVDGRHVSKNRDTSASESNAHPGTEDCPSTTADGALDSDDEESYSDQANSLHDPLTHHTLPQDPPPAPLKDAPPLPPQPGSCMPIPYPDAEAHGKSAKAAGIRAKKMQGASEVSQRPGSAGGPTQTGRPRMGGQSGVTRGVRSSTSLDTHSAPRTFSSSLKTGGKAGSVGDVSVYVDLAYLPSDPASPTVDVEFFRRIRSSCYIISGDSPKREGLMRRMLDALLEGKASWSDAVQVTVIPTYESAAMQEWYQQTLDRQRELDISVLGSNSTVAMQDETFPACKIEF